MSPCLFPPSFILFLFIYLFLILTSVLLIFKLFIYLFSSSFFISFSFKFSFLFFSFIPTFFLISVSSTLYHLSMRVFVMSIDSNFVLEFIA